MADYTWHDETTTRRVYSLKAPTEAVMLDRMLHAAQKSLVDLGIANGYDDQITVEIGDDEIRASFEI